MAINLVHNTPEPAVELCLIPPHPLRSDLTGRVDAARERTLCGKIHDFGKGLRSSRILYHMAIATGVALAIFYLATPPGWFTLGIGAFAGIAGSLIFFGTAGLRWGFERKFCEAQQLEIEAKCLYRCAKGGLNSSPVFKAGNGHVIHIASSPNCAADDLEKLKALGIKTVISVTHPEERKQIGCSVPYTDDDYAKAHIKLLTIDVPDHTLLTTEHMIKANTLVKTALGKGNILVHCQGGKGRSAQAIAAYLIGTEGMTKNAAKKLIKEKRPRSTINNKDDALSAYEKHLNYLLPLVVR